MSDALQEGQARIRPHDAAAPATGPDTAPISPKRGRCRAGLMPGQALGDVANKTTTEGRESARRPPLLLRQLALAGLPAIAGACTLAPAVEATPVELPAGLATSESDSDGPAGLRASKGWSRLSLPSSTWPGIGRPRRTLVGDSGELDGPVPSSHFRHLPLP